MKVLLKRNARVNLEAGSIVEVSEKEASRLMLYGYAAEAPGKSKQKKTEK